MGILGNLFGKKALLSKKIYRAPRVQLLPLHRLKFQLDSDPDSEILIANISESGVGFVARTFESNVEKGQKVIGKLTIGDQEFPVVATAVHLSPMVIGCKFEGDIGKVQVAIHQFLNLELKALNLLEVKQEFLQESEKGQPRWFRGDNNCELYVIENDGKLVHFHISFFGNYFEYNDDDEGMSKMKAGHVIEEELGDGEDAKPKHKGSSLVRLTSKTSKEVISSAIKFVKNIENLSENYKIMICGELEKM